PPTHDRRQSTEMMPSFVGYSNSLSSQKSHRRDASVLLSTPVIFSTSVISCVMSSSLRGPGERVLSPRLPLGLSPSIDIRARVPGGAAFLSSISFVSPRSRWARSIATFLPPPTGAHSATIVLIRVPQKWSWLGFTDQQPISAG